MTMVWTRSRSEDRLQYTLDAIDDALAAVSGRRVFLAADATRILDRAATAATSVRDDPGIDAIATRAIETYGASALVDRDRLLDPLLDIRLLLATAG